MTRTQAEKMLDDMRQQERVIQKQLAKAQEQLLMTRGAIQVLEILLDDAPLDETAVKHAN